MFGVFSFFINFKMKNLAILNSKEIKKINNLIKDQFGVLFDFSYYTVLLSPKKKIYIVNKDVFDLDLKKIRVNSMGLYFANVKNNEIRLSIEGSQLVGPIANESIIELTDEEMEQWIQGIDLDTSEHFPHPYIPPDKKEHMSIFGQNQFVIVKYNNDYIGCGKIIKDKVLNFVPKTRRIIIK